MSFPVIVEGQRWFGRIAIEGRLVRRTYPALSFGGRIVAPDHTDDQIHNPVWIYGSIWNLGFGFGLAWERRPEEGQ